MNLEIEVVSPNLQAKLNKASMGAVKYYAQRVRAYADPYTPFDTGLTKNTATMETDESDHSATIVYNTPYARHIWFGKMTWNWHNGGVQEGGLRGPFWITRMYADKGEQVEREVGKYLTLELNK